jgi:murein DD-endopeptidase MepM/ murein hydrolase activator NlpD
VPAPALVRGQDDRATQRERVATTVADMYAEGDPDLIAFSSMLDAVSTEDLTRRDGVRDVIVGQEARAYDQLKAAEVLLEVTEQQVADARDDVADQREAAAEHLVVMQELETEQQEAKDSVVALVVERRDARVDARQARAHDLVKLRKHLKQQDRIEEMLRRRAARALARARARARAHARSAASAPAAGLLAYPVDGYVTSPFGYRSHPIYHYWGLHDGVDFGGGCGTPLRASAPGRVVASYWSSVYGNRLVVDHGVLGGKGIATIYNHASGYTVGVGDQVAEGQVLGYEGDTGWSTGCHLHFTVMANGQAVDPMNWF